MFAENSGNSDDYAVVTIPETTGLQASPATSGSYYRLGPQWNVRNFPAFRFAAERADSDVILQTLSVTSGNQYQLPRQEEQPGG